MIENRKNLLLFTFFGLLGSFLMFCGDMILYFEKVSGANYNSIAKMSTVPLKRVMLGGLMGPLSAIFSVAGAYVFYLIFSSVNKLLAKLSFLSLSSFFIFAGSYHAVFANLGFVGRLIEPYRTMHIKIVLHYLSLIYKFAFVFGLLWTIIFVALVFLKKSLLPGWIVLFTPTLWILLAPVFKNLIPYPLGGIIYGGWINLTFVVFYSVLLVYFYKKS